MQSVALLCILASFCLQACNADSRSFLFELISDLDNKGRGTGIAISSMFHKCSLDDRCNFIVKKNIENDEYSTYFSESDLPEDKISLKIWKKIAVPSTTTMPEARYFTIKVQSYGREDPGYDSSFVHAISKDGVAPSLSGDGFRVVVFSPHGIQIGLKHFDMSSTGVITENERMKRYFSSLADGSIIAISAMKNVYLQITSEGKAALTSIWCSVDSITRYCSFAAVTRKGPSKPSWFKQLVNQRTHGPSIIEVKIPY